MTATGHALVGAAIGTQTPTPILGLTLSFLSHFVFDKLPHWDTMTNRKEKTSEQIIKETIVDVLLGYFLVALIFIFTLHRSEEHTSELQSQSNLVCRLL